MIASGAGRDMQCKLAIGLQTLLVLRALVCRIDMRKLAERLEAPHRRHSTWQVKQAHVTMVPHADYLHR